MNNGEKTTDNNDPRPNLLKTMGTRPIQFDDVSNSSSEDNRIRNSRNSFHLMVSGTSNFSSNSNLTVLNSPHSSFRK